MTPSYRLTVNGKNITPKLSGRLINLTLTDESGDTADQLDITLDDTDGELAIPPRKAQLQLWIGFEGDLVNKGTFIVDEVNHSGPPDILTIRARSSDFNDSLKTKREQSWHQNTLGDILTTVAKRNGLQPAISDQLINTPIEHIDQTNESDLNLLTRLGKQHGAVATVKANKLLFTPKGAGKTASGKLIKPVPITRSEGDKHNYSETGRDSDYTGVQANWTDTNKATQEKVIAGDNARVKVLRHSYPNAEDAQKAAVNEWHTLKRAGASCTLELAIGNAKLYPETPVKAIGFKKQIDNAPWVIERVVHSLGDGGYVTSVELMVGEA